MIWAAFTILLLAAVVTDARTYRIPNWIPVALAALFAFAAVASGQGFDAWWPHLAMGIAILALGYVLYMFTGMGAGDGKLAAAITLWTGVSGIYAWLVMLTIAMAALAFGLILLRRALPAGVSEKTRVFQKGAPVPLGIALGLAAIAASRWYNPELWTF